MTVPATKDAVVGPPVSPEPQPRPAWWQLRPVRRFPERRDGRGTPIGVRLTTFGLPVIAIRWGTVALGVALAALDPVNRGRTLAMGVPLALNAILRTVRPLRYGPVAGLVTAGALLAEVALPLVVVLLTDDWSSPYVFCLVTSILTIGFATGFPFALGTAGGATLIVAAHYQVQQTGASWRTTVQWASELFLTALVAGYSRRLFGTAEERTFLARQANDLLAELHAVAQTLPASLDMRETAQATVAQMRTSLSADAVALLVRDDASRNWMVVRIAGARLPALLTDEDLPPPVAKVAATARPLLHNGGAFLPPAAATSTSASASASVSASAAIMPLLARSRLVGLIVAERRDGDPFTRRDLDRGVELAGQAALAIDNARWFARLRTVGADEERGRIARDLHDRVGQSLAFVGFELDRISRRAVGTAAADDLSGLREEVRRIVTEVRDTLYDLRTDVSSERDLVATLAEFCDRAGDRTSAEVVFDHDAGFRLPVRLEREVWRIAQEAVTNACRYAEATRIHVRWRCHPDDASLEVEDDGVGLPDGAHLRADAYGLVGMRERADAIGARLELVSTPGHGTLVRCQLRLR